MDSQNTEADIAPSIPDPASEIASSICGKAACVIDTNVLLEVYSCKDLLRAYERDELSEETNEKLLRRARARESLLLLWHLHEGGLTSWSLGHEGLETLRKLSPPDRSTAFETHWTTWFIRFGKDIVLDRWGFTCSRDIDHDLVGTKCDDLLLEVCAQASLPLITNEGYATDGLRIDNARSLRTKAVRRAVPVFTPREYWTGKLNPKRASRRFLKRFDQTRDRFLRDHHPNVVGTFDKMRAVYQFILFGLTSDPATRLPVEFAWWDTPR